MQILRITKTTGFLAHNGNFKPSSNTQSTQKANLFRHIPGVEYDWLQNPYIVQGRGYFSHARPLGTTLRAKKILIS
jgi:hypothetical protein